MTAPVRERPILFSGPMVRTTLDGTTTQTRRVVKPQPAKAFPASEQGWFGFSLDGKLTNCPYGQPGDRLWVRETWSPYRQSSVACPTADATYAVFKDGGHKYRRSGKVIAGLAEYNAGAFDHIKWRSPYHMPRWASRLTLEVTAVRVERVQEISEKDAMAEGAIPLLVPPDGGSAPHCEGFSDLWDSLNAKRGFGWAVNPFVWVVEFAARRPGDDATGGQP